MKRTFRLEYIEKKIFSINLFFEVISTNIMEQVAQIWKIMMFLQFAT